MRRDDTRRTHAAAKVDRDVHAVAIRKLLTILNAIIQGQRLWQSA